MSDLRPALDNGTIIELLNSKKTRAFDKRQETKILSATDEGGYYSYAITGKDLNGKNIEAEKFIYNTDFRLPERTSVLKSWETTR